jgi:hypothetical protein
LLLMHRRRDGGFFSAFKQVAKRVQGALPVVGLVSRLSAPGGGFDELVSWPSFAPYQLAAATYVDHSSERSRTTS